MCNNKLKSFQEVATDNLCLTDGAVCEVFPFFTYDEIKDQLKNDREFKDKFNLAKKGVLAAKTVIFAKSRTVESSSSSGITVSRKVAFVTSANFKTHFGEDPINPVSFPFLQGRKDTEGAILEVRALPDDLIWEAVKVWCTMDRSLVTELLSPLAVHREGQPLERYQLACSSMIGKRPSSLKTVGAALQYGDLKEAAEKREADRLFENAAQQGRQDVGSVLQTITKSSLCDDDDDDFAVKEQKHKRGMCQAKVLLARDPQVKVVQHHKVPAGNLSVARVQTWQRRLPVF